MGKHIFISYSRGDRAYVDELAAHLRRAGVEVWYDYEMATGERFAKIIEKQIDACAALIVVMTPEGADSHWVGAELTHALNRQKTVLPPPAKRRGIPAAKYDQL